MSDQPYIIEDADELKRWVANWDRGVKVDKATIALRQASDDIKVSQANRAKYKWLTPDVESAIETLQACGCEVCINNLDRLVRPNRYPSMETSRKLTKHLNRQLPMRTRVALWIVEMLWRIRYCLRRS